MRWLADECVDASLVARPRDAGHNVVYMAEIAPAESDADVIARAQRDGRLLLTEDKDFGDLVFRRGRPVPGVVLLRVDPAMHVLKRERLAAAIERFGDICSDATRSSRRRDSDRARYEPACSPHEAIGPPKPGRRWKRNAGAGASLYRRPGFRCAQSGLRLLSSQEHDMSYDDHIC